MANLKNKIIVITGAAGGVGSMLAIALAKQGNHIICLGRSSKNLAALTQQINQLSPTTGGSASFEQLDMLNAEAITQVSQKIYTQFGRFDAWINNVGVNNHNAIGPSWTLAAENWWAEVEQNLKTSYLGASAAIKLMQAQPSGYVINLGGGGVQQPKPFGSAYGAAKTAIVKFTETLNLELIQEGLKIRAFAFNPGFIKNPRTQKLVKSAVARQYMPSLETILNNNQMSDIQDSVDLINAIMSGRADQLAGKYFLADDKDIEQAIQNSDEYANQAFKLLRVTTPSLKPD
ncbi:SDR family NAD(P)-dependent oxidoreductase [Algibacillus agarilyticus]|uniref:SDR family NAD(P)-dependent oxidoreductase n=1 Tax=Algibacillus agarilyticus TaxID=2234133 RepID=UPI000DD0013E|nr:SDR family oxidoreductase [Algibacillus agarilyticus]